MLELIKLMLKEEYRFHTSYTSRFAFVFFPIFILIISFFTAININELTKELSLTQLKLSVALGIFFYGLGSGIFGFLGKESMRRLAGWKFLLHTQELLPVKLRRMFLALYLREILFYLSLTLVPLTLGLLISIPLSHLTALSIARFFITLSLAFLAGISFSYLLANSYRRETKLLVVPLSLLVIFFLAIFQIPSILFISTSSELLCLLGFILFNSILGTMLITETTEVEFFKPNQVKISKLFRLNSTFLVKEFLDLKRSNTLPKMLFSSLLPLLLLSMLFWFIELNSKVGFSSISYSIFIGFFCLVIYSWLNNIDYPDFYDSLPTTVPKIIKTKLKAEFCIGSLFLFTFIPIISSLTDELYLLPLALGVGVINFIYISLATAYLTGLRTNLYLFNPKILVKFCVFALLPQIPLTVFSFAPTRVSVIFISFVCLLLIFVSVLLWKRIEKEWQNENFSF